MRTLILFLLLMMNFASHAHTGDSFQVVTYNILYDHPSKTGINSWANRRETVVSYLRGIDADIIQLQEVMFGQRIYLEQQFPDYGFYGVDAYNNNSWVSNIVMYRRRCFEQLAQDSFWLSPTPSVPASRGWDAAQARIASWLRLRDRHNGHEFLSISTHFDHVGKTAREESAHLIIKQTREIADGSPVILTGDFNTRINSVAYRILTDVANPSAFNDAQFLSSSPHVGGDTTYNGLTSPKPGRKIDYIFVSQFSVNTHAIDDPRIDGRFASDHMPVRATIQWAK